jgi:hypothetical protein
MMTIAAWLSRRDRTRPRTVAVEWALAGDAHWLWREPRPVVVQKGDRAHAKAVGHCPAVVDLQSRLFELLSPCDLHVTIRRDPRTLRYVACSGAAVGMVTKGEQAWRVIHEDVGARPILRIDLPYVFRSRECVHVALLPPFLEYDAQLWPGIVRLLRWPTGIGRRVSWDFEWRDSAKSLALQKGQPLCYVSFDVIDPARHVRLLRRSPDVIES